MNPRQWWQEKDHPIWRVVLVLTACGAAAWLGADSLDAKDLAAVMTGAGAQWAIGPTRRS